MVDVDDGDGDGEEGEKDDEDERRIGSRNFVTKVFIAERSAAHQYLPTTPLPMGTQ